MPEAFQWLKVNGYLFVFLLTQAAAIIIWGTRLDVRVDQIEKDFVRSVVWYNEKQAEQDRRLSGLEASLSRLAIIESRQSDVIKRLDFNSDKLDQLLNRAK